MSGQYWLTLFLVIIFASIFSNRLENWLKKRGKSQKMATYLSTTLLFVIFYGFDCAYDIYQKPKEWKALIIIHTIFIFIAVFIYASVRLWIIEKAEKHKHE